MTSRWGQLLAGALSLLAIAGCTRCDTETQGSKTQSRPSVTVLRVQSPSAEQPGAEHCNAEGKRCQPLAAQTKLPPEGIVRTFAGGRVSLDIGGGHRVDLAPLSETVLSPDLVRLEQGRFSLESTPLIEKESVNPIRFAVAGKELSSPAGVPTTTALDVREKETTVTVRRGKLRGIEFPGLGKEGTQSGQTVRLASARAYRTTASGQELPSLPLVAPRGDEFVGLLEPDGNQGIRGLGTMTARLPNTKRPRDGVRLSKHHVRVVIRDGFARTEVEEVFENESPHVLEGRYRFPVPGDASLSRLALWVGDELVEGEVLERDRAANIYERIVDRPVPRDPALLEWVTGGELSLKVFPIVPKKTRRVLLAYNQALSTEGGLLRYVYPLSLGQGRSTKIDDLRISVHVSDSQAELGDLRVLSHQASLSEEGPWKTATVELKDARETRDFVLRAQRAPRPEAQLSAYVPSWGPVSAGPLAAPPEQGKPQRDAIGYFALRISADLPAGAQRPPALPQDRAVILDVSQSQSSATIAAQGALAYGVLREMNPDERFVLLACDSACETYPESGPTAMSAAELEKARGFLTRLQPGGSSDIAGALVAAASQLTGSAPSGHSRQVIYVGDGNPSSGELSAETIAKRARGRLEAIGGDLRLIGAGRTVDEDTLRGLARQLDATFDLLRSGTSLEERIFELSVSLRRPVLRGAKLALPASLRSVGAEDLPALRLGQELIVSGEIVDLEASEVLLHGKLAGAAYQLVRPIAWQKSSSAQNPLVVRLWARKRIERLQGRSQTPQVRAEIVALSKAHRTMSRHTSFLVLESDDMYEDFGVERTTRSEDDQPDATFSRLEIAPPPPDSVHGKGAGPQSFDEIAPQEEHASRTRRTPLPRSTAKPRPRPSSAPSPKKSSSASSSGLGLDSASAQGSASVGRGDVEREEAAEARPSLPDDFRLSPPPPQVHPPRPPRRPRARLTFSRADDEWRKWGAENLRVLERKLAEDDESRARHEAYIRGHLQHGRFEEARRDAQKLSQMDPDYAPARQLLAYAAVVDGDHELARRMLDVQTEAAPRDLFAHTQSARSFEVVGDVVRACAHYRTLAELAPGLKEARVRAKTCWAEVLGQKPPGDVEVPEGKPGQLQVDVECAADVRPQDCPSPVVVAPDGSVLSPWTPGVGRSSGSRVTFVKLRSGSYYVLILGGSPSAHGKVVLTGRSESEAFSFEGGGMHTIAKTEVRFW